MSLVVNINAALAQVANDIKALRAADGTLTALTTTNKSNLVAAINEIKASLASAGVAINDTAGNGATTVTWSADKIHDTIVAAKDAVKADLIAGAPTALDTLSELSAALNNDPNFAATLAATLNNKVDFATAQTLTAAQKLQACNNIGVGDPTTNFVTAYTTARDTP